MGGGQPSTLTLRSDWSMRAAMAEGDRIIATVTSYDEFVGAIRKWIVELGTTRECVGELAGLPSGYLNTLLVSTPIRSFSRMSLGATLGALALRIQLVIDNEKLAAMQPRYTPRKQQGRHANDGMPTKRPHYLRKNSEFMRLLRHRGVLALSRHKRRAIARKAAKIRWARNGTPRHGAPPAESSPPAP
jgi:hypothetical protein